MKYNIKQIWHNKKVKQYYTNFFLPVNLPLLLHWIGRMRFLRMKGSPAITYTASCETWGKKQPIAGSETL